MRVVWTEQAVSAVQQTSNYILANFGVRGLTKFLEAIQSWTDTLQKMPLLGKVEPLLSDLPTEYCSVVIGGHSKLIYSLGIDYVLICDIWDTRREPRTLVNKFDK